MKTKITIILIIFYSIIGYSQTNEFAPIGAKWRFNQCDDYSPSHIGYVLYESVKDTVINTKLCKAIKKTQYLTNGATFDFGYEIVYYSDSILYYWDYNNFVMMCDFKLKLGDTLNVGIDIDSSLCDSTSSIIVDSVKFININGVNLKAIYLSYSLYYSGYPSSKTKVIFIERIGYLEEFVFHPFCGIYDNFCGINPNLRCYEDSVIGVYKANGFNYSCDTLLITNIEMVDHPNNIKIYPNPFYDKLTIESFNKIKQLLILDSFGNIIKMYSLSKNNNIENLNLSDLPPGYYCIKIITKNIVQTFKIIKL